MLTPSLFTTIKFTGTSILLAQWKMLPPAGPGAGLERWIAASRLQAWSLRAAGTLLGKYCPGITRSLSSRIRAFLPRGVKPAGAELRLLEEYRLEGNPEDERENLVAALRSLSEKHRLDMSDVSFILPRHQVFMKNADFPPGTKNELKEMLRFAAEKYVPFPVDDAVIDHYAATPAKASTPVTVTLVAAKKTLIEKYLDLFRDADVPLAGIGVSSVALQNFVSLTGVPADPSFVLLSQEDDSLELAFVVDRAVVFSRGIRTTAGLALNELGEEVFRELDNSIASFKSLFPGREPGRVLVAGRHANKIAALLRERSELQAEIFDAGETVPAITNPGFHDLSRCLFLMGPAQVRVNLLPPEKQAARRKKRARWIQLRAGILSAGIALLFGVVYLFSNYGTLVNNRRIARRIETAKDEIALLRKMNARLTVADRYASDALLPLEIIREISLLLPANAYIVQLRYDRRETSLLLKGRTDSYAAASRIVTDLGASPCFGHVASKGARMTRVNERNLIDFEIYCTIRSRQGKASP